MKKKYYVLEELLPALIESFDESAMFDVLEEGDVISFFPLNDDKGGELLTQTNLLLSKVFEKEEVENYYAEASCTDKVNNPVFFWKDYINCFYNLDLIDDDSINDQFLDSAFGMYRVTEVLYITEVNKRFDKRRINGIKLDHKVNASASDRKNHWIRTYDKDF